MLSIIVQLRIRTLLAIDDSIDSSCFTNHTGNCINWQTEKTFILIITQEFKPCRNTVGVKIDRH